MIQQHHRRRVSVALTILAALMALTLAACDSAASTPAPAPSTLPPAAASSTPLAAATAPSTAISSATGGSPVPASASATLPPVAVAASPTGTPTGTSTPAVATLTSTPPAASTSAGPGPNGGFAGFRRTPGPTGTPLPTFAPPAGFPSETPAPDYLSWARPGPYRSPYQAQFNVESFKSSTPLVTTIFFNWYDFAGKMGGGPERQPSGAPITYLPSYADSITFVDSAWYEKEFSDMLDAGIDFVMPDYWGEPGQYARRVAPAPAYNYFSTQGIPPMIEALDRLRSRGKNLKMGLFLDTTILNNEDLTTTRGKEIFYASIRDFYARIPPVHWAAIDGKPVVWLYDAQKVGNFDQSSFDYVYEHFAQDFGGMRPYIVREWQWMLSRPLNQPIKTDGLYGWGAAPNGFNVDTRFTIAEVGPGFGQLQFGGRDPIYTDRQGGKYYEDNLKSALRSRRKILSVETWNEYDEATGVSETIEWGRQYIDLTRKYVDMFKAGKIP